MKRKLDTTRSSFNYEMHERNPYRYNRPNFKALGLKYPQILGIFTYSHLQLMI